jgi:hypothetical protein
VEAGSEVSEVSEKGQMGLAGPGLVQIGAQTEGFGALAALARAAERDLSTQDLAPATKRAYASDWADFSEFCARHELTELPAAPQTLALYLKSLEVARSRAPSAYRR